MHAEIRPGNIIKGTRTQWLIVTMMGIMLVAVALVVANGRPLATNLWSIRFLQSITRGEAIPAAPAAHRRSSLWQVQAALRAGNTAVALQQVEALPAGSPLAMRAQAELATAQGDWQQAIVRWEEIGDYNSLATAAKINEANGQVDNAYLAYRAAYRLSPQRSIRDLAKFLVTQGSDAEAGSVLYAAIQNHPEAAQRIVWLRLLGSVYLTEYPQSSQGEELLTSLLVGDYRDAAVYVQLGRLAYETKGDVDGALRAFAQADRIYPQRNLGAAEAARVLAKEGRFQEADALFKTAAAGQPTSLTRQLAVANNARSAGDYADAEAHYLAILAEFGDTGRVYSELAWLYRLWDQPEQAQDAIDQAVALDSANATTWYRAGQIFQWTGATDRAIDAYRMALQLRPDYAAARKNLDTLAPIGQ